MMPQDPSGLLWTDKMNQYRKQKSTPVLECFFVCIKHLNNSFRTIVLLILYFYCLEKTDKMFNNLKV